MPRFDYPAPTLDYNRPDMSRFRLPSRLAPDLQEFWDELLRKYDEQQAPPAAPPPVQPEPPPIDQTAHETPEIRSYDPQFELGRPLERRQAPGWAGNTSYKTGQWIDDLAPTSEPAEGQGRQVPPVAPVAPTDVAEPPAAQDQGAGAALRPISVLVDGRHYVVPSIGEDGRQLSVNEAIAELKRTGKHYGSYGTTEESEAAAEALRSGAATPPTSAPPTMPEPTAPMRARPSSTGWKDPYAPAGPPGAAPIPYEPPAGEQPQEPPSGTLDEYTAELLQRPKDYAASTLSRIAPAQSKGEEPDFYGYDDEKGFSIDERTRRAQEAYRPQQRSTRWEEEFLDRHLRPEDQSVRARSAVIGFFGTDENAKDFRTEMYKRQQDFDTGQALARSRDKAESQIDPGLAEAIASMGIMSPEAAGRLTYDSPVVQAFQAGGYNLGPRQQQQELERDRLRYGMLDKYAAGEQKERGALVQGAQRQETARLMAEGQKVTEEERQGAMRGAIMMAYGIPKDVATQVVATYGQDMNGVPKEYQTQVQSILEVGNVARNRTDLRTLMGMVAQLAKGPAQTNERINVAYGTLGANPGVVEKNIDDEEMTRRSLKALRAWQGLTPFEKNVFVKIDQNNPIMAQIRDLGLSDKQVNVGRMRALQNALGRANSGLTLTPPEIRNNAAEAGITADGWIGLGKDPAAFEDFLRSSGAHFARRLKARRQATRRPTNVRP